MKIIPKTFVLPRQNRLVAASLFTVAGIIDFILSTYLCDSVLHNGMFLTMIVLQFYFIFEIANSYSDRSTLVDFRSQENKLNDQADTHELMIEGAKAELMLRVLDGTIDEQSVRERIETVDRLIRVPTSNLLGEHKDYVEQQ